jgi:hypothetical protein
MGMRAFLPCPRDKEGVCPYRRPYGCTDAIRGMALESGGHCIIEAVHYDKLAEDLLRILDYREGEEPGEQVLKAVELLAEAIIYARRATSYELRRMVGEVPTTLRGDVLRYQKAGGYAWRRREADMVMARMRELHLDVDRIIEDSGGLVWTWWRESCKARWMRHHYMPRKDPPKEPMPDPRAARLAQWKRWEEAARKVCENPTA